MFPLFIIILLWLIKGIEYLFQIKLTHLGIYPLDPKGLIGIITAPLIHGNITHLADNTIPLFLLTWGLFYFYNKIAFKVFLLIYFISGFWVWFAAREAYHIGASGIIYGLGAFLSIRNNWDHQRLLWGGASLRGALFCRINPAANQS